MPPIDAEAAMRIIREHPVFRRAGYIIGNLTEHGRVYIRNFIRRIPSLSHFLSTHPDTRQPYLIQQFEDACQELYEALHGKLFMDLQDNITPENYPDNRGYNAAQRNYFHDSNNLNLAEETYRISIQRIFLLSQMILNRTSYKLPTPNDGILFLAELFCSQDTGYEMNTDEISDRVLANRIAQLCGHQRVQNEDGTTSFPAMEELPTVTYNEETGHVARYGEDRRQALLTSGPSVRLPHGAPIPDMPPFRVHHYHPRDVFPGTPAQQEHRAADSLTRIDDLDVRSPISLAARRQVATFQRGRIAASDTRRAQRRTARAATALMNLGNAPVDEQRGEKRRRDDEEDEEDDKRMRLTHDERDIDGGKRRRKTSKKSKANKKRKVSKKRKTNKKRKTVRRR